MKAKVQAKINELSKRVEGRCKLPTIIVKYDLKSKRVLGSVLHNNFMNITTMRLNEGLLKEFGDKYINEVVVHEFAHIVVRSMYPTGVNRGKKVNAHGKEFKNVCSFFGIEGKSTTSLFTNSETLKSAVPTKSRKFFVHRCACSEHPVGATVHNKIICGARYMCKNCKTDLQKEYTIKG